MGNNIIYKVVNKITQEIYIGATSKSLEERKKDHLQKASKKTGSYFQEAIETYGSEAFNWEQIDTAENSNELAEKESKYIFDYKAQSDGYNSDRGGGIKKIVYQYNKNGTLIGTYKSLTEIKEILGFQKQRISNACINSTVFEGSYWSYNLLDNIVQQKDSRMKSVIQFSLNEEFIESFYSASEASRKTGISKTCITRCCRGERKNSGGYIWKYF
ncbi:NUMOD1 domain-containing DNA-binding protein [Flavobacterium anhuiense]|uniref:NUMOD1 domain-containing DNA-binding protein n=1 Tax=Flavobacterium anhuiense TaxID=459526 RepID=UPI0034D96643